MGIQLISFVSSWHTNSTEQSLCLTWHSTSKWCFFQRGHKQAERYQSKGLAYPRHHPAVEAGKLGIVIRDLFFHHPAEGRGGSQSWVQDFKGKGDLPRWVFAHNTRQPSFGDGAREDWQLSPAARPQVLMPTAMTGRLKRNQTE